MEKNREPDENKSDKEIPYRNSFVSNSNHTILKISSNRYMMIVSEPFVNNTFRLYICSADSFFDKRTHFNRYTKRLNIFKHRNINIAFMFGTTVSKKCSENCFQRAEANNMTIRRNVFKAKTCKKFRCKFIHKFLTKKSTYKNLNPQMALESSNINGVSVALSLSGCTLWLPRERSGV